MTDNNTTMTWADLAEWLAALTPEQLAMPAIVFDSEVDAFTSAREAFLANKEDAGEWVYGEPPSEVIEGQLILKT